MHKYEEKGCVNEEEGCVQDGAELCAGKIGIKCIINAH